MPSANRGCGSIESGGVISFPLATCARRPVLRTASTIVLNGGAVAVDSQRREPLELVRTPTGQSRSDGSSAATGQSLLEVAARLSLVVWEAYYSPPALVAKKAVGSRRRQRAAVPSRLRQCSSDWLQHRYDLCRTGLETRSTDRLDHCLKRRSRGS